MAEAQESFLLLFVFALAIVPLMRRATHITLSSL